MEINELRGLSPAELKDKLEGLRKSLMDMQFKREGGSQKPHLFREARKDIARIMTVLKEKENKQ